MMSNFKREIHNPIELIKSFWPDADTSHITYDKTLRKGDFSVIRECGHDGTLCFTFEMLQRGLIELVNSSSYCTYHDVDWGRLVGKRYTIGSMRHVTVFGKIKLRCSATQLYSGQKERIRMPVKCEYIYKQQEEEQ